MSTITVGRGEGVVVYDDGSWAVRVDTDEKIRFELTDLPDGYYRTLSGWTYSPREDGTKVFSPGTINVKQNTQA